jgi:arginyl-tRNA--protein-N-Asp/Glu arginylyltransferase
VHQFQPSRAQKRVKKNVEDFIERGIERGSGATDDKPMIVEKSPHIVQEEITTVLQSVITAALEKSEFSVKVPDLDTGISVRWSGKGNQTPQLMSPIAMKIEKLTRASGVELSKQEIQTRVKQVAQKLADNCSLEGTGVTSVSVFEPGFVKFHLDDTLTKRLIDEHSKLSSSQEIKAPKKNNNAEVAVEKKHQLEVTKHKPHLTDEVFNVYREFQVHIHGDKYEEVTEKGMTEFLIDTPLMYETSENGVECGSYHMHWRLDGELIAVAVLDIMPHSVNSVYFFWNPKYRNHAFGIYSALKEIEFCKTLPGVEYYFLGWYIHTCSKMNYKRKFKPCYILCPDTLVYVPYQEARPLMDEFGYTQLAVNAPRPLDPDPQEMNEVLVQYFGDLFKFGDAKLFLDEEHIMRMQERIYEFVRSVGTDISKRIVVLLN